MGECTLEKCLRKSPKRILCLFIWLSAFGVSALLSASQDLLSNLGQPHNFRSKRISSYDRTGGNRDRLTIEPNETAVLAEIEGPAPHLVYDFGRAFLWAQNHIENVLGR